MTNRTGLLARWQRYRPSKIFWFASCVFCAVAAVALGFTYGGWVTKGTAQSMAKHAREDARERLLASICVDKFIAARDAKRNLRELKSVTSTERDDFIESGGWADIGSSLAGTLGAVDLCAEKLVAMDQIPPREVNPISDFLKSTKIGG